METYHTVMVKVANLQKKAKALLDAEKVRVLVEMRKIIDLYDIQTNELFPDGPAAPGALRARKTKASKKVVLKPKYRDPATGKTWNGHGKRPFWLGKNADEFLIDRPQPAPAPVAAKTTPLEKKAVSSKKPVAKKAAAVKEPVAKKAEATKAAAKPAPKATVKAKAPVKKKPTQKNVAPAPSEAPAATPVAVVPAGDSQPTGE